MAMALIRAESLSNAFTAVPTEAASAGLKAGLAASPATAARSTAGVEAPATSAVAAWPAVPASAEAMPGWPRKLVTTEPAAPARPLTTAGW